MQNSNILLALNRCTHALEEKKAENIVILDVRGKSTITDYLIIATGTSEPHLRAMRIELEKELDAIGVSLVGHQLDTSSGWLIMDAFDFMVHLFTPQMRSYYDLESFWKDAKPLDKRDITSA